MPTNPVSLLLYVGLLLPGFAFAAARLRHRPIEVRSAFFESTAAVFISVLCDSVVLALGLGIGQLCGLGTQIRSVLRDPGSAYESEPVGLVLGTIGFLLVATVIGVPIARTSSAQRSCTRVMNDEVDVAPGLRGSETG